MSGQCKWMQYVCVCAYVWYRTGDKQTDLRKTGSRIDTCGRTSLTLTSVLWLTVEYTTVRLLTAVHGNRGISSASPLVDGEAAPLPHPSPCFLEQVQELLAGLCRGVALLAKGITSSTWLENLKLFFRAVIPIYTPLSAHVSADLHPCQHLVVSAFITSVDLLCTNGTHGGFCIS